MIRAVLVLSASMATAVVPTLGAARTGSRWEGAPSSVQGREAWLERRIRNDIAEGALDGPRGRAALSELAGIRRVDAYYRSLHGYDLNDAQRSELQARLDDLRADVP
jgi:hypothetical protein